MERQNHLCWTFTIVLHVLCFYFFYHFILSRNILNKNKGHKGILWVAKSRPLPPQETYIIKRLNPFKFHLKGNYTSPASMQKDAVPEPHSSVAISVPAEFSYGQIPRCYSCLQQVSSSSSFCWDKFLGSSFCSPLSTAHPRLIYQLSKYFQMFKLIFSK